MVKLKDLLRTVPYNQLLAIKRKGGEFIYDEDCGDKKEYMETFPNCILQAKVTTIRVDGIVLVVEVETLYAADEED